MRLIADSQDPTHHLPEGHRLFLEDADITDMCVEADTEEGWADLVHKRRHQHGYWFPDIKTKERRTGRLTIRPLHHIS